MKRKILIIISLILLSISGSQALEIKPYDEKLLAQDVNEGKPYAIHFYAEWCMICQQQKFMINELNKDDRFSKLTVYQADFDFEKKLKEKLKVERQSTIIIFKDGVELSRSLGKKDKQLIGDLFKLAF